MEFEAGANENSTLSLTEYDLNNTSEFIQEIDNFNSTGSILTNEQEYDITDELSIYSESQNLEIMEPVNSIQNNQEEIIQYYVLDNLNQPENIQQNTINESDENSLNNQPLMDEIKSDILVENQLPIVSEHEQELKPEQEKELIPLQDYETSEHFSLQ